MPIFEITNLKLIRAPFSPVLFFAFGEDSMRMVSPAIGFCAAPCCYGAKRPGFCDGSLSRLSRLRRYAFAAATDFIFDIFCVYSRDSKFYLLAYCCFRCKPFTIAVVLKFDRPSPFSCLFGRVLRSTVSGCVLLM